MSEKSKASGSAGHPRAESTLGSLFLVVGFLFLKFAPPVLLGMLAGFGVSQSVRPFKGWFRIRTQVLGLLALALVLYVAVGLPVTLSAGSGSAAQDTQFQGLLASLPGFVEFVGGVARWWNTGMGAIFGGMRINTRTWNWLTISRYCWITFPVAAASCLIAQVFRRIRTGKDKSVRKDESDESPGLRILAWPAHGLYWTYFFLGRVWFDQGRDDVVSGERPPLRGAARTLFGAALFLGVGALVASWLERYIPFLDLKWTMGVLLLAPGAGLLLGLIAGIIQWVSGGLGIRLPAKKPVEGFELGRDARNKPYVLTPRNLAYHIEIVASSGAGKTNLLKNLLMDRIGRGHGVVFLDLKADFEVVSWMVEVAAWANREQDLRLVSLADPEISVPYNPVAFGTAAEIHSQLMNAFTWSEEYYRSVSSVALMALLQGLCAWRDASGEKFHLGHVYELLDEPGAMRAFGERLASRGLPASREVARLAERLDRPTERKEFAGLLANLNQVIYSAAGRLLTRDVEAGQSLSFREATDDGKITYFLMNSLKLKESAKVLGKLVLQDLMRVVGDRYAGENGGKPITLIIDEFGAFALPEFIEFMDRARGAGVGIVIAHQSRADLAAISPEFMKRVEANANTKIIGSLEDADDREHYARILGTKKSKKETLQMQDGFFGDSPTGIKSVREVEEFVVHPNEFVNLGRGQAFTVSRTVDSKHGFVRTPLAPEPERMSRARTTEALLGSRKIFMEKGCAEKYISVRIQASTEVKVPGLARSARSTEVQAESDVAPKEPSSNLWS